MLYDAIFKDTSSVITNKPKSLTLRLKLLPRYHRGIGSITYVLRSTEVGRHKFSGHAVNTSLYARRPRPWAVRSLKEANFCTLTYFERIHPGNSRHTGIPAAESPRSGHRQIGLRPLPPALFPAQGRWACQSPATNI